MGHPKSVGIDYWNYGSMEAFLASAELKNLDVCQEWFHAPGPALCGCHGGGRPTTIVRSPADG